MKGEGLYFLGKRDRAPVSDPFWRERTSEIFVSYMFVVGRDLPGERESESSQNSKHPDLKILKFDQTVCQTASERPWESVKADFSTTEESSDTLSSFAIAEGNF